MSETLERPVSRLPAPIRALRPRQWVKNFLVVLAPLAAGWLFRPEVLRGVALAFVAFCLVSSAVYLLNDIRDVEEDRLHPKKRFRPIAAGELGVPVATVMALVLGLGGLALGYVVDTGLAVTLGVYVVIQILYSTVLKHLPVIDLAVVSSGFLLRAIAGVPQGGDGSGDGVDPGELGSTARRTTPAVQLDELLRDLELALHRRRRLDPRRLIAAAHANTAIEIVANQITPNPCSTWSCSTTSSGSPACPASTSSAYWSMPRVNGAIEIAVHGTPSGGL